MKRKIIIDTDPGHDDAMALILAVKSGVFEIQAITTVCGNSTIANTTRNTRYVLGVLGRADIPVYSGAGRPLVRSLVQAVVHGKSGLDGIDPTNPAGLTGNAVEKMLSIIKANPHEITLVTLGPLTNVAQAIERDPDVMRRVREVVMMGGAIEAAGNKNRVAEFNIYVDPEAADVVYSFPVKKTMVPLDACNDVKLYEDDFRAVKNTSLRPVLLKMVRPYIRNIARDEGVRAALMYDPITVYYLMNPDAAETYSCNVAVETKGEYTRGMTVADRRTKPADKDNVTVVRAIAQNRFRKDFIRILSLRHHGPSL